MCNQLSEINPGAEITRPNTEISNDGPNFPHSSCASNSQLDTNIPNQIGKYKITKKVGSGSFSVVYAVINLVTGEQACVKIIPKSNTQAEVDMIQLAREIKILSSVSHNNIIKFIEFLEDEYNYYIFQEISDGASLLQFLSASEKPLSESLTRIIFKQLINALIFLHQNGIYHRDIKLENILINTDMTIKLIDFGFCNFGNRDSLLKTICGSLRYLPPECIKGEAYSGDLADVWSAGVVLFILITKLMPFNGSNQPQIIKNIIECNYEIPDFVLPLCADLIKRIFVTDPNNRITTEQIFAHPWMTENEVKTLIKPLDLNHKDIIMDQYKLNKLDSTRRRSFSTTADIRGRRNPRNLTHQINGCSRLPKIPRPVNQTFVTD